MGVGGDGFSSMMLLIGIFGGNVDLQLREVQTTDKDSCKPPQLINTTLLYHQRGGYHGCQGDGEVLDREYQSLGVIWLDLRV